MAHLFLVSTPIGNLEDITIRAIRVLLTVPVIACEDTRRTGSLLHHLKETYAPLLSITPYEKQKLISYYDEVEEKKSHEILDLLENKNDVALVSDAGTPLVSDPGYRLVQACIKKNITITSVPGPSSILVALPLSGFPSHEFLFIGYLPQKEKKKKELFHALRQEPSRTIICLESSHRILETLKSLQEVYGDISVCVARELTKVHETIYRGTISDIFSIPLDTRGEFVLIFQAKLLRANPHSS